MFQTEILTTNEKISKFYALNFFPRTNSCRYHTQFNKIFIMALYHLVKKQDLIELRKTPARIGFWVSQIPYRSRLNIGAALISESDLQVL